MKLQKDIQVMFVLIVNVFYISFILFLDLRFSKPAKSWGAGRPGIAAVGAGSGTGGGTLHHQRKKNPWAVADHWEGGVQE